MNIVLWVLQVLLALMFVFHGRMMWSPPATMAKGMEYVHDLPPNLRRFIGVAEILGGIGLVLPALLNILTWLAPLAAAGTAIIMAAAAVYHIPRREYRNTVFNLVLVALSAFVAYGRWFIEPI